MPYMHLGTVTRDWNSKWFPSFLFRPVVATFYGYGKPGICFRRSRAKLGKLGSAIDRTTRSRVGGSEDASSWTWFSSSGEIWSDLYSSAEYTDR